MAVSLTKGGRVDLTKGTGLKKAMLGLGWDVNRYQGSEKFDLDLVIFMCDANSRCIDDNHFIFYGTPDLKDPAGSVIHSGDERTGARDGDDEKVLIDFDKIPANVEKIIAAVTIYDAKRRSQNFGMVDNSYVHMVNTETNEEILRYDLGEDFSIQTSVIFAEIYKHSGEWKFKAVGEGYEKELLDLCIEYGIEAKMS